MTDAARKNAANTPRGRPFEKGNPGRPKGARNRATLACEALLDGEAEEITRKAIELAKAGDGRALRLCMERIVPARKDRAVSFVLPEIAAVADLPNASAALLDAVAAGDLTPMEAAGLGKLLEAHCRAIEVTDLQARLARLEEQER